MKIFVTGTRGIPDIPGGVEKHCQELYPLIAAAGHEVILATRSPYVTDRRSEWKGVSLTHLFAPHRKSFEAIVHTFLAVICARLANPDILHIHAVGPGIMVPFARLLGLRVVVTNHGPDYDRQKWGFMAKTMLWLGEYLSGRFANEVIVISRVIAEIVRRRCGREANLIYNGVPLPEPSVRTDFLEQCGVAQGRYVLAVARFVAEKGLHDLIKAFRQISGSWKLVIAGDADHETAYSRWLKLSAQQDPRVVLVGYITGDDLNQVYSHARLFCLPSYHEGLPIALLEAMSYGLPALVSDIAANLEVGLPSERYFRCGDVKDLRQRLEALLIVEPDPAEQDAIRRMTAENYNWPQIAAQTIGVYEKARGLAGGGA